MTTLTADCGVAVEAAAADNAVHKRDELNTANVVIAGGPNLLQATCTSFPPLETFS